RRKTNMTPIENLTWIILLLLNPLVRAHRLCENPATDDVNDIPKLIGNLPNDYRITLKYVEKMESLPNHCWLHLMVPEFSKSLNNLLHKFSQISEALSNHSIINSLARIINDLMECLVCSRIGKHAPSLTAISNKAHALPRSVEYKMCA
uniref:Kit ligand n=1 Tax=Crocodylus porosus TaxID=8502 RepID=A0A7M4FPF6_CROPO